MLVIERVGFATLQDAGRPEYADIGVTSGGFADTYHAQLANALLGNKLTDTTVEIYSGAFRIHAKTETVIAFVGADVAIRVRGKNGERESSGNRTLVLQAEDRLEITRFLRGQVLYLALAGGVKATRVLDATSYDSALGLKPLRIGAQLHAERESPRGLRVQAARLQVPALEQSQPLRFIRSAAGVPERLTMRVDARSHRHALIAQDALALTLPAVVSRGVLPGVMQLPPNGKLLILGVDAQTVGGYPELGCVIRADLWRMAQLRANETVELHAVSLAHAHTAWLAQQQTFARQLIAVECAFVRASQGRAD